MGVWLLKLKLLTVKLTNLLDFYFSLCNKESQIAIEKRDDFEKINEESKNQVQPSKRTPRNMGLWQPFPGGAIGRESRGKPLIGALRVRIPPGEERYLVADARD